MEPIVIFGLGIVIYCGWLAIADSFSFKKSTKAPPRKAQIYHLNSHRARPTCGQVDAAAEHWQERRAGSF